MKTPEAIHQKKLFVILSTFCEIVATVKRLPLLWWHLCDWVCFLSPREAQPREGPEVAPSV